MSRPPLHPAVARQAVDRALARAFPGDADPWDVPRDMAASLMVREGLTAEAALARCGVHIAEAPRPPRVAFVLVPYGDPFRHDGRRYRKVRAKTARLLAQGAPNATPLDGGDPAHFAPDALVEPVRKRLRSTRPGQGDD